MVEAEQDFKAGIKSIYLEEEEHIIDLAASFNCKNQDEEYNKAYKKWRSDKKNAYAFNYVRDTREHTYLDGVGFISHNPCAAERASLSKNMNILGLILTVTFLIEAFGPYICAHTAAMLGGSVYFSFFNGLIRASDLYIVVSSYLIEIIRCIIPIILLVHFMKLPKVVMFPMKILNKDMHFIAVPSLLILIVVCNYFLLFYNKILDFFTIKAYSPDFFMPESVPLTILIFLLNVFISPVLFEFLLRGAVMQSLRQFGDGFALLVASIISALMYHDLSAVFYSFIMALAAGYFVLYTGSLLTGILMHVFLKADMYLYYYLSNSLEAPLTKILSPLIQISYLLIGFIIIFIMLRTKKNLISIKMQETYVSLKEKLLSSLITFPTLIWFICIFVQTLLTIKFKE